ncbi:MAG: tRNA (adenosine(37)-N6)-threonylcarbamoyltransferase complex ATPase subunit type 1 TsaE [Gammaproteobacteria bacterium]|nr:tRNA (adenosine(37)-N6)-threonylcarbamoyltransferase complex ATPase subunit type 1 TsaE [Gammaproteobacteria bacterium]
MPDEAATLAVASRLAPLLSGNELVFLEGELGAGKTTFCRGLLRALGHTGAVKSPTFTLVEPYEMGGGQQIFHFDLYRLTDASELEYIGIEDYLDSHQLCLVEWPERGEAALPTSDLTVSFKLEGSGRRLKIEANSKRGGRIVRQLGAG